MLKVPGTDSYSVIVMDVDGTMVGPDFTVSPRLSAAVRSAQSAGATVSIATGRMMRGAAAIASMAGINGPVICYQGAVTFFPDTNHVVRHERLDSSVALEAVTLFKGAGAHINVYVDDEVYVERVNEWAAGYSKRIQAELHRVPSLETLADRRPTLVLAVDEAAKVDRLLPDVERRLDGRARVTHSLPNFCEVGAPGAGKERALEHLSIMLGVPPRRFVAFGDGKGDAGMLGWAGMGVAVGASHPDVAALAAMSAPGPDEDGVPQVIESLLEERRLGA